MWGWMRETNCHQLGLLRGQELLLWQDRLLHISTLQTKTTPSSPEAISTKYDATALNNEDFPVLSVTQLACGHHPEQEAPCHQSSCYCQDFNDSQRRRNSTSRSIKCSNCHHIVNYVRQVCKFRSDHPANYRGYPRFPNINTHQPSQLVHPNDHN